MDILAMLVHFISEETKVQNIYSTSQSKGQNQVLNSGLQTPNVIYLSFFDELSLPGE